VFTVGFVVMFEFQVEVCTLY